MFRRLILANVVLFAFLLSGCVYKSDVRPTNQVPSTWVCEEAQIQILIPDGYKKIETDTVIESLDPICTIFNNGCVLTCNVLFDYGAGITFSLDESQYLYGTCIYEEDSFTVCVETDKIFNGKYSTLIFRKVGQG